MAATVPCHMRMHHTRIATHRNLQSRNRRVNVNIFLRKNVLENPKSKRSGMGHLGSQAATSHRKSYRKTHQKLFGIFVTSRLLTYADDRTRVRQRLFLRTQHPSITQSQKFMLREALSSFPSFGSEGEMVRHLLWVGKVCLHYHAPDECLK